MSRHGTERKDQGILPTEKRGADEFLLPFGATLVQGDRDQRHGQEPERERKRDGAYAASECHCLSLLKVTRCRVASCSSEDAQRARPLRRVAATGSVDLDGHRNSTLGLR